MPKVHDVDFYVQIKRKDYPRWRDNRYVTATATKITQDKPTTIDRDTVVVKLKLQIEDVAFEPATPTAVIAVPTSSVARSMHVIVEDPS